MLIRTQDKKGLVNITDICMINIISNDEENPEGYFICVEKLETTKIAILGKYSTEEKAIKVLDIMQARSVWEYKSFDMPDDEEVEV